MKRDMAHPIHTEGLDLTVREFLRMAVGWVVVVVAIWVVLIALFSLGPQ